MSKPQGIKAIGVYSGKNKISQHKNTQKKDKVVYCFRSNGSSHNKSKFKTGECRACQHIGQTE